MPAVIDTQIRNYIIHGLAEGLSIRSLERIFGTNRETVMRYQILVGKGCHYSPSQPRTSTSSRRLAHQAK